MNRKVVTLLVAFFVLANSMTAMAANDVERTWLNLKKDASAKELGCFSAIEKSDLKEVLDICSDDSLSSASTAVYKIQKQLASDLQLIKDAEYYFKSEKYREEKKAFEARRQASLILLAAGGAVNVLTILGEVKHLKNFLPPGLGQAGAIAFVIGFGLLIMPPDLEFKLNPADLPQMKANLLELQQKFQIQKLFLEQVNKVQYSQAQETQRP